MVRRLQAWLFLVLLTFLCGCSAGRTSEVAVPEEQTEQSEEAVPEEPEAVPEPIEVGTEPGTVLGEEKIVLMQGEEAQTVPYTRIQGLEGFTIAYDPEYFTLEVSEKELCFQSYAYGPESETPVSVRITEMEGASAQALADQYAAESNQECLMEEVTAGEGEYPAIWVSYSEGMDPESRTCDLYVIRYNEKLYVVQMDCFVEGYEEMGAAQESLLSTLRFDEG